MSVLRIFIAFVAGAWLYQVAVVLVGGMLAAVTVPVSFFHFFGHDHLKLALALHSLFAWAVPVALIVCGGILAVHTLLATRARSVSISAFAGMIALFAYWAVASLPAVPDGSLSQYSLLEQLSYMFVIPWWASPPFLAPWFGFACAAWLVASSGQRRRGTEA